MADVAVETLQETWSEESAGAFLETTGYRLRTMDGVVWCSRRRQFWRPIDLLLPRSPINGPRFSGYHYVTHAANATCLLPITVIEDIGTYPCGLKRKARQDITASHRRADVALADSCDLLLEQGYRVWQEAAHRSRQWAPPDAAAFRRLIELRWRLGPQIVVTGTRDGRLGGFLMAHIIGEHCYFDEVVISDAARQWRLGAGMYDAAIRTARALGAQIVYLGSWAPEIGQLDAFKVRMGARNRLLPAHSWAAPGVARYLRTRRPLTAARLLGTQPGFDFSALAPTRPPECLPG